LRGAEFLLSRPEVDAARIGIQGDDLAVIVLARRPAFTAAVISDLLLYRLLAAAEQSDAYPAEEVNDFLRARPDCREAIARTLEYFDATRHAPAVRATTMLVGEDAWLEPLTTALGQRAQRYQATHRGAEDHDHLDAWLAGQLGTQPRSRFRDYAPPALAT
jgi:cephalosporin-C deacetylase-like acetyl esterase